MRNTQNTSSSRHPAKPDYRLQRNNHKLQNKLSDMRMRSMARSDGSKQTEILQTTTMLFPPNLSRPWSTLLCNTDEGFKSSKVLLTPIDYTQKTFKSLLHIASYVTGQVIFITFNCEHTTITQPDCARMVTRHYQKSQPFRLKIAPRCKTISQVYRPNDIYQWETYAWETV